ncbi:DddA-like double-stranded DNA deaminase toxin [Saccharothrix coeruleofusca]|uniref:DddA-like double-stranded DNA deaminase toxin n=1 Tax=Saccharothrix coeruleofusca TaxID=33919 RepID=UPI0035574A39
MEPSPWPTTSRFKSLFRFERPPGADATLAVNNRPCDVGPLSCVRIVPRVLRPGQSLTVHWPGGVKTYTGKER